MTQEPEHASSHPLPGERTRWGLRNFPPVEEWDHHTQRDPRTGEPHDYMLVPTTCFNCESACGLLAYVDKADLSIRKVEGNPAHPGSRGRNCAKGPATINQVEDPERILFPLRRTGKRGEGGWERVTWDAALDDIAGRIRRAIQEDRHDEVMYHVGRPGEDGFAERFLLAWGVDGHNSHTNICSAGARLGYSLWGGYDRPRPTTRTPRSCCSSRATWRRGTTSTPTPSGSCRPSSAAPSSWSSTPGSPTPPRTPTRG